MDAADAGHTLAFVQRDVQELRADIAEIRSQLTVFLAKQEDGIRSADLRLRELETGAAARRVQVDAAHEDLRSLKSKSNIWDLLNSIGVFASAFLGRIGDNF